MVRYVHKVDPVVAAIIQAERHRQNETLELIASENHASSSVMEATGSVLTDKYAEGYPGRRWYCGCENADAVEQLAIDRAKKLFGAEHVNVQPHTGTNANLAVYLAALNPGQTIMGMRLDQGGHLSHGLDINLSGICYKSVSYGLDPTTEMLDMDEVRRLVLKAKPDILVAGASALTPLLISILWAATAAVPPALLLVYAATGQGVLTHIACKVGMAITAVAPAAAVGLVWAIKDFTPQQFAGGVVDAKTIGLAFRGLGTQVSQGLG